MRKFPIGIMTDSLKTDFKSAVAQAAKMGAAGVQTYCTSGAFSPEQMTREKIRETRDTMQSNGMIFSAICGDLGHGFTDAEKNGEYIEKSKRIMELAKELDCNIVTTHIGVVPQDKSQLRYKIMQEACFELAEFADDMQAHFAIETGPEPSLTLKGFLDSLHSHGVSVNLDPANLVMVTGDDPVQAVYNLKDYIVHTHAKDGVKLCDSDPEVIYGMIEDVVQQGEVFRELPLGEGGVPFSEYLRALEEIGYTGFLTIEREVGENPAADIMLAVEFLRNMMNES